MKTKALFSKLVAILLSQLEAANRFHIPRGKNISINVDNRQTNEDNSFSLFLGGVSSLGNSSYSCKAERFCRGRWK